MRIRFPYHEPAIASARIDDDRLMGVFGPRMPRPPEAGVARLVAEALKAPIESPPLGNLVRPESRIVLLVDDITRTTPIDRMLPPVLDELARAGVPDGSISAVIALGTHRPMTRKEIEAKCGVQNTRRIEFVNHAWQTPSELAHIGRTELGFDILVNRRVVEADLVIGFGHIVPHSNVGFSGGGKIVMPGVSGQVTLDQTHWASVTIPLDELMGRRDNPIRAAIDEIARRAGMRFIVNVVPRPDGLVQQVFCGDVTEAHRRGCELSRQIYGVPIPSRADIVVVDSAPADIDLRQATKGVISGSLAAKRDGVVVLITPCPEGVAPQFPEYEEIGFRPIAQIRSLIEQGRISGVAGETLAGIGQLLAGGLTVVLASPGVKPEVARRMGFLYEPSAQTAIDRARALRPNGTMLVLTHGGEALPVVSG